MRRSLALAVTLACLAVLLMVLPAPVWLRAVVVIPLALALPGYAVAARLYPVGSISPAERAIYTVTFSIAIATLGGTVVQLALGLGRTAWTLLLAAITIGLALPRLRLEDRARPQLPRFAAPALALVGFLAAAALTGVAIHSASAGVSKAQQETEFTEFWMLPRGFEASAVGARGVAVGVGNHTPRPTSFTLRVSQSGRSIAVRHLDLAPGERWERVLAAPTASASRPIIAALLRGGALYRRLHLRPQR